MSMSTKFDPIDHFIKQAQMKAADKGWADLSDRETTAALFGWLANRLGTQNGSYVGPKPTIIQLVIPSITSSAVVGGILYAAIRTLGLG